MKLLVVGGGGREHAIIKKLKENKKIEKIYALPGNGGIAKDATCVDIGAKDIAAICDFAKKENIERYHFTSVFAKDVLKETVRVYEKSQLKKKLGIEEDKMILSVGSFIHRKGFDVLMNAMENLPKEWGVYIVGGEPTEEYMKLKEKRLESELHEYENTLKEIERIEGIITQQHQWNREKNIKTANMAWRFFVL